MRASLKTAKASWAPSLNMIIIIIITITKFSNLIGYQLPLFQP